MKAHVFPGQGSQKKGMGGDIFDAYKDLTQKADSILGYSIKDLCLNDLNNTLGQTQYTQPALYVVDALSHLRKIEETGKEPDYVAGHSLGEYVALFAAGIFDFETGLKLVKYRGQMMAEAKGGAMAAIIGLKSAQIAQVLQDNNLNTIDIANLNASTQIVISGLKQDIETAKPVFEKIPGAMVFPLSVSGAFHSRYMKAAAESFSGFIDQFTFSSPKVSVIANVNAQPYTKDVVKENLYRQIFSAVRWYDTIKYMLEKGVDSFDELGPGNVLARLVQKIQSEG